MSRLRFRTCSNLGKLWAGDNHIAGLAVHHGFLRRAGGAGTPPLPRADIPGRSRVRLIHAVDVTGRTLAFPRLGEGLAAGKKILILITVVNLAKRRKMPMFELSKREGSDAGKEHGTNR